jgi:hypothetical protein
MECIPMNRLLASTALALALTTGAYAQTATGPAAGAGSITQQQAGEYLADDVIGAGVRNAQNENIGTVSDLVIDRGGQVRAAIVSVGGFLGIGDKHVAVPWDDVQIQPPGAASGSASGAAGTAMGSTRSPVLMVNMTKDQLKQAPAYRTAADQRREEDRSRPAPSGPAGTGTNAPGTRTTPSQ